MSKRDEYPAGVPCWVETLQPDPRAALGFYGSLLGWEFSKPGPMPGGLPGEYFVARVEGREVAGIGALPDLDGPPTPSWSTYVRVDSTDAAVNRATNAGGSLLIGPLDASEEGRFAVLGDPAGAPFCVWEARNRAGAQLVNEPRSWAMSSLHTPDPAGASAFYGSVFGWRSEAMAPGAPVTLFRLPDYAGEPGQPIPRDVVGVMTATGADRRGAYGPTALERQPARRRHRRGRCPCRRSRRHGPRAADGHAWLPERGLAGPPWGGVLGQPGRFRLVEREALLRPPAWPIGSPAGVLVPIPDGHAAVSRVALRP